MSLFFLYKLCLFTNYYENFTYILLQCSARKQIIFGFPREVVHYDRANNFYDRKTGSTDF